MIFDDVPERLRACPTCGAEGEPDTRTDDDQRGQYRCRRHGFWEVERPMHPGGAWFHRHRKDGRAP